jgi:hypothetical protein
MTPFEQQLKDALARRATDAQPREEAITEAQVRLQHSGRARGLTVTGLMACTIVIAVVGVTVAIPRMGEDGGGIANFAAGAERAGTFKLRGTTTNSGEGAGSAHITGEVDLERKYVHMVQTFERAEGFAPPSEMSMSESMEIIITEAAVYMRIDGLFPNIGAPENKKWFKMPTPESANLLVQSDNPLSILFPTDPTGYFDRVFDAASRFEEVGTATIENTSTIEYEVTIDMETLVEEIPAEKRAAYESIIEDLGKQLVMHIWIGDDGLLYRQTYELAMGTMRQEMSLEFYDYGEPVDIQIPPEDEVADQEDLEGNRSGSFSSSGDSCTTEDGVTVCERSGSSEGEPCEGNEGETYCTFTATAITSPSP